MLILISNIIYGKYSYIHSKERSGKFWVKERMFLRPMFSKVSCKFEAINWKTAGLSSSFEFVGELMYQQNQRPTKYTQVLWATAINGSPWTGQGEYQTQTSNLLFSLGQIPVCISSSVQDNKLFWYCCIIFLCTWSNPSRSKLWHKLFCTDS